MKVGDLVRDTSDGVVGIITRGPYVYGKMPLLDLHEEPSVVDILWSIYDKPLAMHLAAFKNGIELIS